jgi:succinoglycan biosynthesis protein ExoA
VTLLVVVPCLNEAAHLGALLDALRRDRAAADARFVVADGGSTDASIAIVRKAAQDDARIVLLNNPARVQSAGVNAAVRAYGGDAEFLVRVDAHAAYPENYLSQLLAAQRESGADAVAVSMRAVAAHRACFQAAAAAAQNSVLGAGGSPHRKGGARRWVDHGHHALISVRAFHTAGGYDETFTHNEDAEFDKRLVATGGRILLALKHKMPLKLRQLAPAAIAPIVTLSVVLTPFAAIAALPATLWIAGCLGFGLFLGAKQRRLCACAAGAPAAIMHFAWSIGFLRGAATYAGQNPRPQRAN